MNNINEIENIIEKKGWVKSVTKGNSGVGLTLEYLLGKEKENFELPDYKGIEIKTKYSEKETYITLFNATPDSYLFETKRLVNNYGYPDKKMPEYNVLNVYATGNRKTKIPSNYYLKLNVDRKNKKVILNVYDKNKELIDTNTAWSFEILKEKIERKLQLLAIVKAERKWDPITKDVFFKYNQVKFYQLKSFEAFIGLIEIGLIRVVFKIGVYKEGRKKGQIYDHGTGFTIQEFNIENLFKKI